MPIETFRRLQPSLAAERRPRPTLVAAVLGLAGGLLGPHGAPAPACASVLPPYAEHWFTPGQPEDVDVDPFGRVWVACSDDSVRVYAPRGGQILFAFGGTGEGDGQFHDPFGIQFAPDGTVYVCDYAGARVERFTSEGEFLQAWAIPSDRADHVAIDAAGDVYVTGFSSGSVHKYDATGNPLGEWPSAGGGRPSGALVVGEALHVAPWDVAEVEQYALDGTFLGSFPVETTFGVDLEQDALGQLWLADWINHVIRVYTAAGEPIEVLGEPGGDPGQFSGPVGIAFGTEGSVYVADQLNGRVQRFGDPVADVPTGQDAASAPLALRSIAPNPSRGPVALTYSVPRAERFRLTIADMAGRRIATLADGWVDAGEHRLTWDGSLGAAGRPLPAGHYFVHIESASGGTTAGRFIVVR